MWRFPQGKRASKMHVSDTTTWAKPPKKQVVRNIALKNFNHGLALVCLRITTSRAGETSTEKYQQD